MGVSSRFERGRFDSGPCWLDVEASALPTSVAVMAPALTEGGPPKLENLLPSLTAGGFLTAKQALQVCQNREVLAQFIVSAAAGNNTTPPTPPVPQPSKTDEQCLRGIPEDLIRDVIKLKFGKSTSSSSHPQQVSESANALSKLKLAAEKRKDSVVESESAGSNIIMNDDPSSAGDDPSDSMGFLKTIMDRTDGLDQESTEINDQLAREVAKLQEDNNKENEMVKEDDQALEQYMSFGSDIIANNQDLGPQNVEEILQVIKSMESAENLNSTREPIDLPISQGTVASSDGVNEIFPEGFSFGTDLLNDVDVIGLCAGNVDVVPGEEEQLHESSGDSTKMEAQVAHQQEETERRQFAYERRCSFLLRRLRKLQTRWLGQHGAEEVTGVLEMAQRSAKRNFLQELEALGSKSVNVKNLPELGGTLHSFMQKVEKSCFAQSNSNSLRHRNYVKYFGSGSRDSYSNANANRHPAFGVPRFNLNSDEIEAMAGPLKTKLKVLQSDYDSDCTASSSGGESCDEMQTFNNAHQQQLPITKRAGWRYARERAAIAARWTWLSAQISDLEFKIHHHNDVQRTLRSTKGPVVLEGSETINGYMPSSGVGLGANSSTARCDTELPASRTRSFVWSAYRKRKLVQMEGLHEVSKRAARPATLRCSCDGALAPCALCTGREDPMLPQEPIQQLSTPERIALVDPGFHPVLSFPEDCTLTVHMDAILKNVEWQQKIARTHARTSRTSKDKDVGERRAGKKLQDHPPKFIQQRKKTVSTAIVGSRPKQKVIKGVKSNNRSNANSVNRKRAPKAHKLDEDDDMMLMMGGGVSNPASKHSSPVPSPGVGSADKNTIKEKSYSSYSRMRQNSYDIDNIVIPYSVAASARPEKLEYKEILIPKWRLCDELEVKNGALTRTESDEKEFEDISDEAFQQRHDRSEREEYKRFTSYLASMPQSRLRPNRRADSRADSGANTPDAMSPYMSDGGGDAMTSSPIEGHPIADAGGENLPNQSGSLQNVIRRKTLSAALRLHKDEPSNQIVEEEREQVPPYEPRNFPLSDEVYEKMVENMPERQWQAPENEYLNAEDKGLPVEMDSHESDSTESAVCDGDNEDPNDPEWTVPESRESEKERIRPTAKR